VATRAHRLTLVLALGLLAALSAALSAAHAGAVTLPPANGQFDYQIGGAYTPLPTVAIVDRDRLDPPVLGRYNVCYVNAFQTQPEDAAWWIADHPDLLVRGGDGRLVSDPDWPGEYLLDTSTAAKRAALEQIVGGWIDRCAGDGFQAVEPDNLDSWTRSGGALTQAGDEAFATLLATRAHADGLAIAQKNATAVLPDARAIGFDFAIAEECQAYGECDAYTAVYGDQVYEIEYADDSGRSNFAAACAARGASISIVYRDRDVAPSGSPGYLYDWC
jgi:Glycoside-hydrolase family GH114